MGVSWSNRKDNCSACVANVTQFVIIAILSGVVSTSTKAAIHVTPQQYGATFGGGASASEAFQKMVNAAAGRFTVEITPGAWLLTNSVKLPSNTKIVCDKGAQINWDASSAHGSYSGAFTMNNVSNIIGTGPCLFNNTNAMGKQSSNFAFFGMKIRDVHLSNMQTHNMNFLQSNYNPSYEDVNEFNLSYDVSTDHIRMEWDRGTTPVSGCLFFQYTARWQSTDDEGTNCHFTLYWWGGDGAANGALENARWAQYGTIKGTVSNNTAGGGVWGSMGYKINATGLVINTAGDVGIDDEGGVQDHLEGTCTNAVNGCATTFYLPQGIILRVKALQSNSNYPCAKIYNSRLNPTGTSVILHVDCTYTGPGLGIYMTDSGAANFSLSGSSFNATINTNEANSGIEDFKNISMKFTQWMVGSGNALVCGGMRSFGKDIGRCNIQNVTIHATPYLNLYNSNAVYIIPNGGNEVELDHVAISNNWPHSLQVDFPPSGGVNVHIKNSMQRSTIITNGTNGNLIFGE